MSNEQTPTPESLADTKVLPRYRELDPGEIILETDEAYGHGIGPWSKVNPWTAGKQWNADSFHPVRRRIDPAPKAPEGGNLESYETTQPGVPFTVEGFRPASVSHGERAKDIDAIQESLRHFRTLELYSLDLQYMEKAEKALYRLRMAPYEPPAENVSQISTLTDALSRAREALAVTMEQWQLYYKVELGEARFADCAGTEGPVFARCLETKALLESLALAKGVTK